MADDASWSGPTVLVNGQAVPLINIKPPSSQGSPGYNGGTNSSGNDTGIAGKITSAAEQHGVDPDFALKIAHAESGLNPNATSPKGAHGVMQLMPDTAKGLGVNPHDVDQNIDGGVRYIKQLSDKYNGDKSLIAAAYNAGPGAVDQHGGVPPFPETQAYVQKVTGGAPQGRPSNISDDDWNNAKAVTGSVPTATASPNRTSISDNDWDTAKPIQSSVGTQTQPPQQTPGYKQALGQAQQNPNSLGQALSGTLASINPIAGAATAIPGAQNYINSALNGLVMHALPVLQGAQSAIGTGIANTASKIGIGKGAPYSAGESYAANRDASQNALNQYTQAHPIMSTAADLGGQIAGSAAVPELKGAGLLARLGYGALKVGGQSALTGAGGTASEGGNLGQIGTSAAVNGALGAVMSPVGELGEGAAALGKNAGAKTALRFLVPAAVTGGAAGGLTYKATHNPGQAAGVGLGALALAGAPGLARSKAAQSILAKVLPEDKLAALTHLGETLGNGDIEAGVNHLESNSGKSVVEAANPENRSALMKSAGEVREENLVPVREAVTARQHPQAVKTNLKSAIGETSTEGNLAEDLHSATGVNPAEAEMSWADKIRQQHIANSELWRNVETEQPVQSAEHTELLKEPVVRQAVADAQRLLGPRGSAPNPNYKPPAEIPNVKDLSDKDLADLYKEASASGKLKGTSFDDLQEYLNSKHQTEASSEPETLPTQAAFIVGKRNLAGQVSRDNFGKVLPNHKASDVAGYKNFEINSLAKRVNAANEQHFEGLKEANKSSHEEFGAEEAKEQGNNIGSMGKKAESPEAFAERWKDLNSSEQEGLRHGYMQQVYKDVRANPDSAANKYSSDYHKDFQKTLFGDEGTTQFQQSLYNDKLRNAIDKIPIESGNIEPKNLAHLENLLNSESEQKLQNQIYGKEKADQIRDAIRQEIESAKLGKSVSDFKVGSTKEHEPLNTILSGAFGGMSKAGGGLGAMAQGVALGASSAKTYQMVQHAHALAKQGNMTPAARQHLGELLARPASEVAAELKAAVAQKRNMKLSKSTTAARIGHAAALATANTTGKVVSNAFNGIDTGQ